MSINRLVRLSFFVMVLVSSYSCNPPGYNHWQKAQAAYDEKDWDLSITEFEEYLEESTEPDIESYFLLGNAYYETGDFKKAQQLLDEYIQLDGSNSMTAHYKLACILSLSERLYLLYDAEKHFQTAVSLGYRNFENIVNDPDLQFLLTNNYNDASLEFYFLPDEEVFDSVLDFESQRLPFERYRIKKDLNNDSIDELIIITSQKRESDMGDYESNSKIILYGLEQSDVWRRLAIIPREHNSRLSFLRNTGIVFDSQGFGYLEGSLGFYDLDGVGKLEIILEGYSGSPFDMVNIFPSTQIIGLDDDWNPNSISLPFYFQMMSTDEGSILFGRRSGEWVELESMRIESLIYENGEMRKVTLPKNIFQRYSDESIKEYRDSDFSESSLPAIKRSVLTPFWLTMLYQPEIIIDQWIDDYYIKEIVNSNKSLSQDQYKEVFELIQQEYMAFLLQRLAPVKD